MATKSRGCDTILALLNFITLVYDMVAVMVAAAQCQWLGLCRDYTTASGQLPDREFVTRTHILQLPSTDLDFTFLDISL